MPVTLAVIGGTVALGQTIYGAIKKNKAEKAAAANQRPAYEIPQEEYQNERQAESMAGNGISAGAKQYLTNQSDRSQAAAYSAILRGGGDANAIANTADKYQNSANQVAIYDDQARLANLGRERDAWLRMSANKDKAFQVNQYAPYADRAAAIKEQLTGAENTINSGLNSLGSAGMGAFSSLMSQKNNQIKPMASSGTVNSGANIAGDGFSQGYNGLDVG